MTNKTKWVLQDVGLSNVLIDDNFITCKQLNLPYVSIGTIPFTSIFTNLENVLTDPTEKLILRTGTKTLATFFNVTDITQLNPNLSEDQIKHGMQYLTGS